MNKPIKKQTYEIKDFIGVFDNFLDPNTCDQMIKWFNEQDSFSKTYTRLKFENTGQSVKKDLSISVGGWNFHTMFRNETPDIFAIAMNNIFNLYNKETDIMKFIGINELHWKPWKIQKTSPTGGYHVWHVENSPTLSEHSSRVTVFTVYLNDVEEGGETEFLFQKQRCKAKKGRVCVFPAYFPYVHRGNPPLKKDKYIATGWLSGGQV